MSGTVLRETAGQGDEAYLRDVSRRGRAAGLAFLARNADGLRAHLDSPLFSPTAAAEPGRMAG